MNINVFMRTCVAVNQLEPLREQLSGGFEDRLKLLPLSECNTEYCVVISSINRPESCNNS